MSKFNIGLVATYSGFLWEIGILAFSKNFEYLHFH